MERLRARVLRCLLACRAGRSATSQRWQRSVPACGCQHVDAPSFHPMKAGPGRCAARAMRRLWLEARVGTERLGSVPLFGPRVGEGYSSARSD